MEPMIPDGAWCLFAAPVTGSRQGRVVLAQLRDAGLVAQRREGRSLIYSASYDAMDALVAYLMENCCAGAGCAPGGTAQPERNCQ